MKKKNNLTRKLKYSDQNNLADLKFSIQQNNNQIMTIQKKTSEIQNLASLKLSIRPSNNCSSTERDINVLRKNISNQRSLSTTMNNAPTLNQAKTDSSLIGKKLVIYVLTENIEDDKQVQIEKDRNSLLQMFRDTMELEAITVSDCFRLGKEQPDESRPLIFYIPWHHKFIFLSLRKLKKSKMYIKELMSYADAYYQNERKILKYRYDLSSLKQKEKSEFKIKARSLVFGV